MKFFGYSAERGKLATRGHGKEALTFAYPRRGIAIFVFSTYGESAMKRAGKRPKGKAKPGVLNEQEPKIYPPDLHIVIGGGLSRAQMVTAMATAFKGYWDQTEELNAKRKR